MSPPRDQFPEKFHQNEQKFLVSRRKRCVRDKQWSMKSVKPQYCKDTVSLSLATVLGNGVLEMQVVRFVMLPSCCA